MPALLDDAEVRAALAAMPGWDGGTAAIRRLVSAPDFPTAIRIVDDIAVIAEELNHHPDIDIRWRKLRFTLSTHSAGGVTQYDLTLARRIDEVASKHGAT
jgi:4a-hydroxytetrahydrobiopterin dehydratase